MSIPADRPHFRRRYLVRALLTCTLVVGAPWRAPAYAADPAHLPTVTSLAPLLERSQLGMPVVALFSRADCPWCEALRRDQLVHLAREARAHRIQVVEFDLSDNRPFKNRPIAAPGADASAGERTLTIPVTRPDAALWAATSPADLARQLGVRVVPTVAFLGAQGELAQRLVGYASRDFYGAYLTQRIDESRALLIGTGRP
jgi:hypothetical protein